MQSLVELFAGTLGWKIAPCNFLVEGTSDVAFLWLANSLYFERHGVSLLGGSLAVLASGKGDDGGVDGLNRRLNAVRQMADADRGPDGALRFRFFGLYDNDRAGRRAIDHACQFDRRLRKCGDLFLLYPVMSLARGADCAVLQRRLEYDNRHFTDLDCEIEDLISERLLVAFERKEPSAVVRVTQVCGRKHRDFTRQGKARLQEFCQREARFEDMSDVIKLLRALHDYHRLPIDYIQV
jgi:hypothetical protein